MSYEVQLRAVAQAEAAAEGITGVRQRAVLSDDDLRPDELVFEAETLEDWLPEDEVESLPLSAAMLLDEVTTVAQRADLESPPPTAAAPHPRSASDPPPSAATESDRRPSHVQLHAVAASPKRASTVPPPPPLAAWRAGSRIAQAADRSRKNTPDALAPIDGEPELVAARRELIRAANQMRARDAYLRELERALESQRRQLASWGLESFDDAARLAGRLRGQAYRIAELEAELDTTKRRLGPSQTNVEKNVNVASVPDDLKAIRGIGPRFEQLLRANGIDSYARVAALSGEYIQRLALLLRIRPERVARDGWIEQARALANERS
jgi:predicted flap endonuclease-1-like 5' DNA nuclease